MRRVKYAQTQTLATGAIVAAGLCVCVAVNWPGHLSYDSVVQLYEGRIARYGNWHPPVMSWLLGVGDGVLHGAGLFVLFDALLLYLSTGALLVLARRTSWLTALVALGLVLTPQYLLYPGIVWKDVLFAVAAIGGFVSLAISSTYWDRLALRAILVSTALCLLVLATLARQNGGVVLPVAATALGWIACDRAHLSQTRQAVSYGIGFFVASLTLCLFAWLALQLRSTGETGPAGQFRLLQTYDLAGALASRPGLALDRIDDDDPPLALQMRTSAARLYTPQRNDTLASSEPLQQALRGADERTIPAQWRDFVARQPLLYVKVRWAAFRWLLFMPDPFACRPAFVGVAGPPDRLRALGIAPRLDARDRDLAGYVLALSGTPLFSHAAFAFLASGTLVGLLRRRRPEDIAIAAMLAAALAFTATFFVISIACDYRYLYFLDAATLMVLFYLSFDAADWLGRLRTVARAALGSFRRENQSHK